MDKVKGFWWAFNERIACTKLNLKSICSLCHSETEGMKDIGIQWLWMSFDFEHVLTLSKCWKQRGWCEQRCQLGRGELLSKHSWTEGGTMCTHTGLTDLASKLRHPQHFAPLIQPKAVLCHHGHLLAVSKSNPTQIAGWLWGLGREKLWGEMKCRDWGPVLVGSWWSLPEREHSLHQCWEVQMAEAEPTDW